MKKRAILAVAFVAVGLNGADITVRIERPSFHEVGGMIGGAVPNGAEERQRKEERRKAEAIALQERDRLETLQYLQKHKTDAAAMTNRVMQFRLKQATNGNATYQLLVSTNFLRGTDGFPVDTKLANYWLERAKSNSAR